MVHKNVTWAWNFATWIYVSEFMLWAQTRTKQRHHNILSNRKYNFNEHTPLFLLVTKNNMRFWHIIKYNKQTNGKKIAWNSIGSHQLISMHKCMEWVCILFSIDAYSTHFRRLCWWTNRNVFSEHRTEIPTYLMTWSTQISGSTNKSSLQIFRFRAHIFI